METLANAKPLDSQEASQVLEMVLYRIIRGDSRGRPFGTPRNPAVPTIVEFNPKFTDIQAGKLGGIMRGGRHGTNPDQAGRISQMSNDELIRFREEDPLSGHVVDDGFTITGGHHRFAEIIRRVESGELSFESYVRVLLHD